MAKVGRAIPQTVFNTNGTSLSHQLVTILLHICSDYNLSGEKAVVSSKTGC